MLFFLKDLEGSPRSAVGHATIALTLDTYSRVLPSMQKSTTDKLKSLLYKKRENKMFHQCCTKSENAHRLMRFSSVKMVAWDRIELPTRGFSVRCSTN